MMDLISEQPFLHARPVIDAVLQHRHLTGNCLFKLWGIVKKMQVPCSAVSVLSISLYLSLSRQMYVGVGTTVQVSG